MIMTGGTFHISDIKLCHLLIEIRLKICNIINIHKFIYHLTSDLISSTGSSNKSIH